MIWDIKYPQLKYPELDAPRRPYLNYNGSIFKGLNHRQDKMHKIIRIEETNFTQSIQYLLKLPNKYYLHQFFPQDYTDFIIMFLYRKIRKKPGKDKYFNGDNKKLTFLLAGLTLIYTKQEKYIPNSIINNINSYTESEINKDRFFIYYNLIKKLSPLFYEWYPRNQKKEFINCLRYTLTHFKRNGETKSELVSIYQNGLDLCKKFVNTPQFRRIRPHTYETANKIIIDYIYCKINSLDSYHHIPFDFPKKEKMCFHSQKSRIVKILQEVKLND